MRQGITTHKVYEADARYLDFIASGTNIGEHKVSGSLRFRNADISESHKLDGLRVAIEIKPVNLHLKFPFCVIGGVLVIPTWEETGTRAAKKAEKTEEAIEEEDIETLVSEGSDKSEAETQETTEAAPTLRKKDTRPLINRAVTRLMRAGGRKTEGDAAHLLEGIAVVVYDPDKGQIDPDLPPKGSRLRWDEFIEDLTTAYKGRFED